MKTNFALAALLLSLPAAAHATPCKQAIDQAIAKGNLKYKTISTTITPVGAEGLVEVSSLVLTWVPNSDTLTDYYRLASATCRPKNNDFSDLDSMELFDDMPGEGGVTVKTVTKLRY